MKASVILAVAADKNGKHFLADALADLACEDIETEGYNNLTFCYFAESASRGFTTNGAQGKLNQLALNAFSKQGE